MSAAIGFSATTAIQAAPNEMPRITSDMLAVTHEVLVSMLAAVMLLRQSSQPPSGTTPNVSLKRAA
jgi:hypothetical protein